jgi:hypothetical protein
MSKPSSTLLVLLSISLWFIVPTVLAASPLVAELRSLQTGTLATPGIDTSIGSGGFAFSNSRWDYSFDSWQLGTTWWDLQHTGSNGKQVAVSDNGTVHFAWTKGFNSGASTRHTVYACWVDGEISGPANTDNTDRSGYCTLDVLDGDSEYANAAVVAFHQGSGMGGLTTTLSNDWGSCWTSFTPFNHPAGDDPPICPLHAIDSNNKVHLLSNPMYDSAPRYDATPDLYSWETVEWQVIPASSNGFSAVPVTSEYDSQVALLAHDHIPVHPDDTGLVFSQTINDIWAYISADGDFSDWAQVSSINITELLDETTTGHPLPGHVYAYCDIDGIFDADGNLHVTYNTRPYWPDSTLLDGEIAEEDYFERWSWSGQIWHALINTQDESVEFSHVAGYVGRNNEDDPLMSSYFDVYPGDWGSFNDSPSLAIDHFDNTLYCMWRTFISRPDTSAAGNANADLWVRSSCDNGASWGPAVNITDSSTPDCVPGDCASEAWGSLAESVTDGLLHVEFVEDLEAGPITVEDAVWTDNPVWYLQVPVEDVPCGDAWNVAPHATCLTETEWNWGALADGNYEIVDFMHLLNEGAGMLHLHTIELLYDQILPDISFEQINGSLGEDIYPYETAIFRYSWNAVIGDEEQDAIIRFHTNGGTVDFKLANRAPLDMETAQSFTWWEGIAEPAISVPAVIELSRNYPNPFNPTTTIEYTLATPSIVQLEIYNTLGEIVAQPVNGSRAAGTHSVVFDAGDLASGIYFYQLTAGNKSVSQKMVLVR